MMLIFTTGSEIGIIDDWLSEFSPGQSLEEVQDEYRGKIYDYMADYLKSDKPITVDKNLYKRAINDAFTFAFIAGWADAGASALTDEAQAWINGRINEELGYLDTLFVQLKELRANKDLTLEEKLEAADAHADGYSQTLIGVYEHGKMMGDPERDGEWEYGDTDHCSTCASLNGQVHPLSWYLDNGFIPQESGSETLDCHGYNCQCRIKDPKTGRQILP